VSLALKDRAAVLLAGREADAVFWYEEPPGRFVTSSWYAHAIPSWVSGLQPFIASFADSTWTRLLADSAYGRSGPDLVPSEHDGVNTQFPHPGNPAGGAPGPASDRELFYLPYGDRVVLELARRATVALQMGQDSIPDLLLLSCSAADAIGHRYGPGSQEMQDYYLHLDRYLGELFDYLDRFVGANQWFVALASDHGVAPLPEADAARGLLARRVPSDTVRAQIKRLASEVFEATHVSLGVSQVEDGLAFVPEVWTDSARARAAGDDLAARLRSLDWVADVYTRWELSDPGVTDRPCMSLFRNALHPDRGADLFVREQEGVLVTSRQGGTTHGSVYSYDTHVPLLFMGPGIGSARISDSVRTVDLAPTLCDWLGVPTAGRFDGVSLAARLR
jgi:predicted AlkP superfamily pyrophosphatase or phosphodiesterase